MVRAFRKYLLGGEFAVGLLIGFSIAIFLLISLLGISYCPEAPCGKKALLQGVVQWFSDLKTPEQISIIEAGLLIGVLAASVITARAAVKMNNLTKELETPVVVVEPPEGTFKFSKLTGFDKTLKFRLRNVGRTPATITSIGRAWCGADRLDQLTPFSAEHPNSSIKELPIRIGGQLSSALIWSRSQIVKGKAFEGRRFIFFFGFVRYKDVVGDEYECGYCFSSNPMPMGRASFPLLGQKKELMLFSTGNAASATEGVMLRCSTVRNLKLRPH
ncbi:hypothetical protein [Phaeobacter italicus]|uniref:hypothetical protein n=1 Tax=Phaeobacter italicus TaxID=481446 RepID=UPI00295E616B|nr:hypothetical protein [Phaeobacter italicus]